MADSALSINGRLAVGETLQVWKAGTFASVQWQALVNGVWINVGTPNSDTYTIPANAAGQSYRLVGTTPEGTFYSPVTGAAIASGKKGVNAPVLSGPANSLIGWEDPGQRPVFGWLTFSDADTRDSYAGGSLLLQDSTSTQWGGDGQDVLSIRCLGTAAGQFSYNASTRELKYAFTNGVATTIGTVDAALNGNGTDLKVTFNGNATQTAIDALIDNLQFSNNDDSPTEVRLLTLRITDATGASAQRVMSAGIGDVADAPVFTSAVAFQIDENQTAVAALAALDPDREAGAAQGISYSLVAGAGDTDNGLFAIDAATGEMRFVSAPDHESPHGASYSLRVRASDSNGGTVEQVLSVTVRNVDEAPVASNLQATVSEDGPSILIASDAVDPDAGDSLSYALNTSATVGTVTLEGTAFRYDPAGKFQALKAGAVFHDSFTYTVTDAAGHAVTRSVAVTVQGANDAPMAISPTAIVHEAGATDNGTPSYSGGISVLDPDGDAVSFSTTGQGSYGWLVLSEAGQWIYTLDNGNPTVRALGDYQTLEDSIAVNVRDAQGAVTTTQVRVLIFGANDAPVVIDAQFMLSPLIESGHTGTAPIAGVLTSSGSVAGSATDPEGDALSWIAQTKQGQYGTFTIDAAGSWRYEVDDTRADPLVQDQQVTEFFVVRVTDANGATASRTLRVELRGSNDLATIGGESQGHVLEDAAPVLTASGVLSVNDPDAGQAQLVPRSNAIGSAGGVFNVNATGGWSYAIDNTSAVVQGLVAGQTLEDSLTVSSVDGTAQQVLTVTIHGADDAAAFLGTTTLAVSEDSFDATGGLSVGANLGLSDPDAGQNEVQPFSGYWGSSHLGLFSVTAQGDWTWTSQASPWQIESLAEGQTLTDMMGVTSADGTFGLLNVVINGLNDAPVIAFGDTSGQVVEPGGFPPELPPPPTIATGSLFAWDKDNGDVLSWSGSAEGQYGSFSIDAATGAWSYVVDAVKSDVLARGKSALDSFTATVSDNHGGSATQTINITVYGGNETPVVDSSSTLTGTVHELPAPDGALVLDWSASANYGAMACTDNEGRILLLSSWDAMPGYSQRTLARFNPDGSLDTSYGTQGHAAWYLGPSYPSAMHVDAQNRLIAVGNAYTGYDSTFVDFAVTRVLADGSPDTSFGVGGVVTIDIAGGYDYANQVLMRPDGGMLVVGAVDGSASTVVVALNEDGSLDTSFGNAGKWFLQENTYTKQLTIDGQGRLLAWTTEYDSQLYAAKVHVERYLADGTVDATFGTQGTADIVLPTWSADSTQLQVGSDGSIVLATGIAAYYPARSHVLLTCLHDDGTINDSFGQFGSVLTDVWAGPRHTLGLDDQGRIVLAGQLANNVGDPLDFMVARYLADGTLDASFGNGGSTITDVSQAGLDDYVDQLFVNADGTLMLVGATAGTSGVPAPALVRYTADGQLDTSFGVGVEPTVSGFIQATDPDPAWPGSWDPLNYTVTNQGVYGTFSMPSSQYGGWFYTLDSSRPATQALEEGETATDTITVAIRDSFGGVTYQDVVITVIGAYDPPSA